MTEQEMKEIGKLLKEALMYTGHMYEIPEYTTIESIKKKKRWGLIIALASNPNCIYPVHFSERWKESDNAKLIVNQADAIIEELKDEPDEPKTTST